MALIEYIEPVNPGGFLVGIGACVLLLTFAYIIYRLYIKFAHYIDTIYNHEIKYYLFEESFLDKIAAKKGIDLNKEMVKRNMMATSKTKSFRKKVEEQIMEEMFGKEKQ